MTQTPSTIDLTMERLENQISWYDGKSVSNQRWFKGIKFVEMAAAAAIPFAAGIAAPAVITGALGVVVVFLEGLLQLNQHQQNWTSYRSTAEALKHEKYLYLGQAGPYTAAANKHVLLAERVESLISREHAKWVSTQEQARAEVESRSDAARPEILPKNA